MKITRTTWPGLFKGLKLTIMLVWTVYTFLATPMVRPEVAFLASFAGYPMAHPNWEMLTNRSALLWGGAALLVTTAIHALGVRISMRGFRNHHPRYFKMFYRDLVLKRNTQPKIYNFKPLLYLDRNIAAPILEEILFRWAPLFYFSGEYRPIGLILGAVIWPALHFEQVKPRTFWPRWTMLFFIGLIYLAPMWVVYVATHNVIAALLPSILVHFVHNLLSSSSRYVKWYMGVSGESRHGQAVRVEASPWVNKNGL